MCNVESTAVTLISESHLPVVFQCLYQSVEKENGRVFAVHCGSSQNKLNFFFFFLLYLKMKLT